MACVLQQLPAPLMVELRQAEGEQGASGGLVRQAALDLRASNKVAPGAGELDCLACASKCVGCLPNHALDAAHCAHALRLHSLMTLSLLPPAGLLHDVAAASQWL